MRRRLIKSAQAGQIILVAVFASLQAPSAYSAPTAAVAKKCLAYAYRLYPYKRPGSAKGSNARQLYFNDCVAKNGDIPEPPRTPR